MRCGPRASIIDALKSKTTVAVMLDPPRQKVKMAANSPMRGPADAPIQIVEFSDFQCPFCQRVGPSLKQVFDTYGDRDPPGLPRLSAAEPSRTRRPARRKLGCARTSRTSSGRTTIGCSRTSSGSAAATSSSTPQTSAWTPPVQRLRRLAQVHRAGRGRHERRNEAGVNGTPAFFINGRLISGAQPFEEFRRSSTTNSP